VSDRDPEAKRGINMDQFIDKTVIDELEKRRIF